jgi:predicted transcriptional regulator
VRLETDRLRSPTQVATARESRSLPRCHPRRRAVASPLTLHQGSTRAATKTLSAFLDPAIHRATQRVAKEERRPQSAVAAEALRLYTGLPLETRQAVLALDRQLGTEATASKLAAAVRTATLEARLDAIVAQLPPSASSWPPAAPSGSSPARRS